MPLRGHLDSVDHRRITGWAWDSDAPDQPVSVILSCDGQVLARALADRYRPDLERAGIGSGCHAFDVSLTPALSHLASHSIAARREEDGAHLSKSPRTLEPAPTFDRAMQDAMVRVSRIARGADDRMLSDETP